ncbi:MAG: SpoIIE family protein phosphatase [Chthoniobacteraceae bacterium]
MKGTLSARLILWVGLPAALAPAAVLVLAALHGFRRAVERTEARAEEMARYHAAKMDSALQHAQKIPEMMAAELETGRFDTTEKLEAWLRWIVETNPEVYGSCAAFRPRGFLPELAAYAPYVYRGDDGLRSEQLAKPEYNYFQWDWYRAPRDSGTALWSDPYFDEGGGNALMITYSVPFRKDGAFNGIVTIDIAITQLVEEITRIVVGREGYAFLVDRTGAFQAVPKAFPKPSAPLPADSPLLALTVEDGPGGGHARMPGPLWNRDSVVGFAPIAKGRLIAAFVSPTDEAFADAKGVMLQQLALGAAGLVLVFGAIVLVARSVARPIHELSAGAQKIAAGDLDLNIDGRGKIAEVVQLTEAFNKMTRDLRLRMEELRHTTTIKERLEGEMSAARNIQMSLLPKVFPAFPDRREFDVHAVVRPAREVGGDFYDFFLIDERRLCVLIGDVSGKGVPAALFMAVSKALIKANIMRGAPLATAVGYVNDELCEEADAGMFVTLLIAVLDTATGLLEYSNAGHLSPFLLGADGTVGPLDGAHAQALALSKKLPFSTATHQFAPGDSMFLFTDGVTEALSSAREFYTSERLQVILRDACAMPVQRMTRSVIQDVRAFASDQPQADDISVLAVRWLGAAEWTDEGTGTVAATQPLVRSLT